jgi:hypothetical protein
MAIVNHDLALLVESNPSMEAGYLVIRHHHLAGGRISTDEQPLGADGERAAGKQSAHRDQSVSLSRCCWWGRRFGRRKFDSRRLSEDRNGRRGFQLRQRAATIPTETEPNLVDFPASRASHNLSTPRGVRDFVEGVGSQPTVGKDLLLRSSPRLLSSLALRRLRPCALPVTGKSRSHGEIFFAELLKLHLRRRLRRR